MLTESRPDMYTDLVAYLPGHREVVPIGLSWKDMVRKMPGEQWGSIQPFTTFPQAFSTSLSKRRAFVFGTVESRLWKDHHGIQCEVPLPPRWDRLDNANHPIKALDVVTMEPIYHNEGQCDISSAQFTKKNKGTRKDFEQDDESNCYTLSAASTSIAVPYPTAFQASSRAAMAAHLADTASRKRDILVSYAGGSHGMHPGLRNSILEWCAEYSECHEHNCNRKDDCVDNHAILETYSRSVFCLQPNGDTPTRQGWFDALLSGCIPVFFSSCLRQDLFYERVYAPFLPPFERTAYGAGDWAVVVNSSTSMSSLASTLRNVDTETVRRMQHRIADISPGIQYSMVPGVVRDAQTIYTELMNARYGRGDLVYAYPHPKGQTPEDLMQCFRSKFPTPLKDNPFFHEPGAYVPEDMAEWFLHRQLSESSLKTADPSQARLFVVNIMPVMSSLVGVCNGKSHAKRQKDWIDVLEKSPWLQRSKGSDHAFVCQSWTCMKMLKWHLGTPSWYGSDKIESALIDEIRPVVANMMYYIHEDLPTWTGRPVGQRVVVVPYVTHSELPNRGSELNRTTHCIFIGSIKRAIGNHITLARWRAPLKKLTRVVVVDSGAERRMVKQFDAYAHHMRSSVFCLIVAGDTASSRRLFDAVVAGCIPVLVSPPYRLPFESSVRWDDFMIRLDTRRWLHGEAQGEIDRLLNFDEAQIATMRAAMAVAALSLNWRSGNGVLQALLKEDTIVRARGPLSAKSQPDFIESNSFLGHKDGYMYRNTKDGVKGYIRLGSNLSETTTTIRRKITAAALDRRREQIKARKDKSA